MLKSNSKTSNNTSFPVMEKDGNVGIFVLLNFENILDTVINPINLNQMHHFKFKFVQQFI